MQHVEENDVAGENRERTLHVVQAKLDRIIFFRGDFAAVTDLSRVHIQAEQRLRTRPFPKIKSEETNPATDIQDWIPGRPQQLVGGRINLVIAQFAAHIMAKPALPKLRSDPRARSLVFGQLNAPVFHLLRIIALPD
jgi:hypothetical protein